MIGPDVELEILDIGYSQVKLGIRAPREITVLRKEIQITKDQNRAASQALQVSSLDQLRGVFQDLTRREPVNSGEGNAELNPEAKGEATSPGM